MKQLLLRPILVFLLISGLLSAALYREALWGGALLAPLDLAPKILKHYQYMDGGKTELPDNHFIVDQLTYDLPLQKVIYDAYERGEIPWWDPFSYGGRPLLADAHINGTDPIRLLCYHLLPFEPAYNWNLILRGILTGLGMFLLLRSLGVGTYRAAFLGVAYQIGGWFTVYFGHPWIQGSFLYFPYLWWLWIGERTVCTRIALGSLLIACIFYAGNIQSHTYIVIFSGIYLLATFWKDRPAFLQTLTMVTLSGLLGAALASPVLFNQVEFLLNSYRPIGSTLSFWKQLPAIPLSLGAYYPWAVGSFRTIDVGRLMAPSGTTFTLFCGPLIFLLALYYLVAERKATGREAHSRAVGLLLLLGYLIIVGTPLEVYLYQRSAGLGGMGLVVLGGLALEHILRRGIVQRRLALAMAGLVMATAIGASALAWGVYPRYQDRILEYVLKKDRENSSFPSTPELRTFQVRNFPHEVSLRNPEALLTFCLAGGVGWFLLRRRQQRPTPGGITALLFLSLLPLISFHHRYRPKHKIGLWHQLEAGGPAQTAVKDWLGPFRRLEEPRDEPWHHHVFPNALGTLYGVHTVHGYSALQPHGLTFHDQSQRALYPPAWRADLSRSEPKIGLPSPVGDPQESVRFAAQGSIQPRIEAESLNRITLTLPPGIALPVTRTDTPYPGWTLSVKGQPGSVKIAPPAALFATLSPPSGASTPSPLELTLEYRPTYLPVALGMAGSAAALILGLFLLNLRKAPRLPTGIQRTEIRATMENQKRALPATED